MHITMSGGRSRRKKLVRSKRLSKTDSEVEQENINAAHSVPEDTIEAASNQDSVAETSEAVEAVPTTETSTADTALEAGTGSEVAEATGSSDLGGLPPLETVTVPEIIPDSALNLKEASEEAFSDNLEEEGEEPFLDDTDPDIPPEAGKFVSQK